MTTPIAKNPTRVFPQWSMNWPQRYGDAPALIGLRETLSYRQLGERANRYARWALAQGLAKGETVCLLMPNRPEYMAVWIGIIHAGGAVALLNTNLVGFSLAHCIDAVEAKHVIVAAELMDVACHHRDAAQGQAENLAARRALGQDQAARAHRSVRSTGCPARR